MTTKEELKRIFQNEIAGTRKMLELVPLDQGDWKPHEKSMTMYKLAVHLAGMPLFIEKVVAEPEIEFTPELFTDPKPANNDDLVSYFESGCDKVNAALDAFDEAELENVWRFTYKGNPLIEGPKLSVFHQELHHLVHHRAQLGVYLRLLDIPLPYLFGPTADMR